MKNRIIIGKKIEMIRSSIKKMRFFKINWISSFESLEIVLVGALKDPGVRIQ